MNRLFATLLLDIRIQYRNAFYAVTVLGAAAMAAVLLYLVPDERLVLAVPNVIFLGLGMPFYFIAGQVLFEKSENIGSALAVSPLQPSEYLASKVVSLGLIALLEAALVAGWVTGWPADPVAFVAGVLQLTLIYSLSGFILVIRYDSVTDFLMPSIPVVVALQALLLEEFGLLGPLKYLWPVYPGWALVLGSYTPVSWMEWFLNLGLGLSWSVLFGWWACHAFIHQGLRSEGAA